MNPDDASTQVLALCAPHVARVQRPWRLALSGLPGCGKSTLAQAVARRARRAGWPTLALSLDDFYLPQRARAQLAAHVHPLLATRGVPGTHDLALLQHVLARLAHAAPGDPLAVPRFDKGRDTRLPPSRWRRIDTPPRLVILEGWCLGITPQPPQALAEPVNALERRQDRDGSWRAYVNRRLVDYLHLWDDADARVLIQVPDWRSVQRWRDRAEEVQRRRLAPHAMDKAQLRRFLQHYERLGRHALAHPPAPVELTLHARDLLPRTR